MFIFLCNNASRTNVKLNRPVPNNFIHSQMSLSLIFEDIVNRHF